MTTPAAPAAGGSAAAPAPAAAAASAAAAPPAPAAGAAPAAPAVPADGAAAAGAAAAAAPPAAPPAAAAPDKGAAAPPAKLDLKLPQDSTLDAKVLEDAGALASAAGLTPEHAQKVVDLMHQVASTHATKVAEKAVADHQSAQVRGGALWEQRNTQYKADALKDAELGNGDPQKLALAAALGQRALATFFPKEMVDLIRDAGLESHPGLLKGLVKIGKAMKEDDFVPAPGAPAGGKRTADILYDKTPAAAKA